MKENIRKKIYALESEVLMLKKLKEMQKLLLSSGVYSEHNIEVQTANFERLNVPEWERKIVIKMWDVQTKLSHKLLKDIEKLTDEISTELSHENQP